MTTEEMMTSGFRLPIRSLSRPPTTLVMITMTAYRPGQDQDAELRLDALGLLEAGRRP